MKKNDELKEFHLKEKINILEKIKHKPLIIEKLFAYSMKRPFILLDFFFNNKNLNNYFKKFKLLNHIYQNNDLSKNITKFIDYINYLEDFQNYNYETNEKCIKKIIREIMSYSLEYIENEELINYLYFDYLSTKEQIELYYMPINNNLNKDYTLEPKYLDYLDKINSSQKIKLICLLDDNSKNIYEIRYKNINELYFTTTIDSISLQNIYYIFENFFKNITNYQNIKIITFDNQYIINELIKQFLEIYNVSKKSSIKKENLLARIQLEEIILKEGNLKHVLEKNETLFGFNKMFPNLKNKII